jgi:cob(I)alamin adenosyltransferase
MAITVKSGDAGVSYWKDRGVHKDDILIETIGALDELQAILSITNYELKITNLDDIAYDLWGIMGEISYGKKYEKLEERIAVMEKVIDSLEISLPKLDKFVIFKKEKAVRLNWIRTEVRKAERRMVALAKKESLNPKLLAYINRLSDYLFMLARQQEDQLGG